MKRDTILNLIFFKILTQDIERWESIKASNVWQRDRVDMFYSE